MKYKWLLFDADGTLFDYDKAEIKALQRSFKSFGLEFKPEFSQIYRHINAQIWQEFERGEVTQTDLRTKRFAFLSEAVNVEFDPLEFSHRYLKYLGEGHFLIPGAQKILEILSGKIGLMLITNGLKDVQRSRLARSTIQQYFSDVIISEEVGAAKPDKQIFEIAFQKMGHPRKKDVLIIGDSLTSDIRGGNQYGIDTCWFNPERIICDQDVNIQYQITHLNELLPIIGFEPGA
jgi:YjjG family noncanonical pyrimidine nucleotidase